MNSSQLNEKLYLTDDIEKHHYTEKDMHEVQKLFGMKRRELHGRKEYCFDMVSGGVIEIARQMRNTYIPPHFHTYMELIYVYHGKFINRIDHKEMIVQPGDALLLDQNVFHEVQMLSDQDIVVSININKQYLQKHIIDRMETGSALMELLMRAQSPNSRQENYILIHTGEEMEKIHSMMDLVLCEYFDQGSDAEEIVETGVLLLLEYLSRQSVYETNMEYRDSAHRSSLRVDEVLKYIGENYQNCSLESLERKFGFNPHYISSYLRKNTGMSFKEILLKEKMSHARLLLDGTSLPISVIVEIVGFANPTFFYKKFEEYYHMPLAGYQRPKE